MKQIPASILTLVAGVLVTLISLWVGQHHGLLPEQASVQAPYVDDFFNVMVTIATALFLVVQGAIVIFSIRYRQRAGDTTDGVPIEGSVPLEILWTAIPAIIVIGLGVYSVDVYERMGGFALTQGHGAMAHHHPAPSALVAQLPGQDDMTPLLNAPTGSDSEAASLLLSQAETVYGFGAPAEEAGQSVDLTVNVTAMQYAWIFNYPDAGIIAGELHVPLGKDVRLNLAAQDVIHSFWVPQFRLKQDAIPGQATQLQFIATKVGTFPIVCTELCGSYHGSMRSQIIVQDPADYEQWLNDNRIAQQVDLEQAIASNPADLTAAEFLAPYTQDFGIDSDTLHQLPFAVK